MNRKLCDLPVGYVTIYQSGNIFGSKAGTRYYGEVTKFISAGTQYRISGAVFAFTGRVSLVF